MKPYCRPMVPLWMMSCWIHLDLLRPGHPQWAYWMPNARPQVHETSLAELSLSARYDLCGRSPTRNDTLPRVLRPRRCDRRHTFFCARTRAMELHPHLPSIPPLPNRHTADSESAEAEDNVRNCLGGRRAGAGSENMGSVEQGVGGRCHAGVAMIFGFWIKTICKIERRDQTWGEKREK